MATWPVPTVNAPLGLSPDQETVRVINRTGSATVVGECVQFDLASTVTEVTTIGGGETGTLANVITPQTGDSLLYALYAICLEAAADNAEMEVCIRGKVQVLAGGTINIGEGAVAQADVDVLSADDATGGEKVIALTLEAASNGNLAYMIFDGIHGFGSALHS